MASPKGEASHEQDVQHLFRAIRRGKAHLTKFMLAASNNALLKCWNTDGRTPLIECCYIKEEVTRTHMVRILKDAGADVNLKDKNGKTALIHACEQRCNDVVKILIQHANISPDVEDADGNTALIHSACIGNDVALELLVKNFRRLGLNVDHYNRTGYTALHVATANGFIQCAKILALKGKASLTLKDKVHQMTPLELCLKEGFQKGELEFLKPSAKFYRVAKLTTTMAKYRKKSTQEATGISPTASPARAVEKPKSKVKSLLRKSKAQNKEETDSGSASSTTQKPATEVKSSEKNVMSKFLEKSKASLFTKDSHKHALGKTPRQRSFSQSDQQEDPNSASKTKSGLSHSHSHPLASNSLEISVARTEPALVESTGRNDHQGFITLAGEYAEWDTEDPDDDFLGLDFLQRQRGKTSKVQSGGDSNAVVSPTGSDNPSSSNPKYNYASGVISGSSASANNSKPTNGPGAEHPLGTNKDKDPGQVYLCDDHHSNGDDVPCGKEGTHSLAFAGSAIEESYLTSDSTDDESNCSSGNESELAFIDQGPGYKIGLLPALKQHDDPGHISTNNGPDKVTNDLTKCRISNTNFADARLLDQTVDTAATSFPEKVAENVSMYEALSSETKTTDTTRSQQLGKFVTNTERNVGSKQTETNTLSYKVDNVDVNNFPDSSMVHINSSHSLSSQKSSNTSRASESPVEDNSENVRQVDSRLSFYQTPSDYIQRETDNSSPEQIRPETSENETKQVHKMSRSQSECVHQKRSVRLSRTDASSQNQELEFHDFHAEKREMVSQKPRHNLNESFDENDEDAMNNDLTDSDYNQFIRKMPLNSCIDDVLRIRDIPTNPDFVANKLDSDKEDCDSEYNSYA